MAKKKKQTGLKLVRSDPTKTFTLRKKYEMKFKAKLRSIEKEIYQLLVVEDALGLNQQTLITLNTQWAGLPDDEKVSKFNEWLENKLKVKIVDATEFWNNFVTEGFMRGAGKAWDTFSKGAEAIGTTVSAKWAAKATFLQGLAQPESVNKVKLLITKTLTYVRGFTQDVLNRITQVVADGLVTGSNPRTIARNISRALRIPYNRAVVIAQTEIIRAHAEGQLQAMEAMGIQSVTAMVEWSTAGDDRVCPLCIELHGIVLKLEEARGLIPRHARCRCSWIPANVGEDTTGQRRSKDSILAGIKASLGKEKKSNWPGADVPISEERPEGL